MDWLAWLKYFSIPRYGLAVSLKGEKSVKGKCLMEVFYMLWSVVARQGSTIIICPALIFRPMLQSFGKPVSKCLNMNTWQNVVSFSPKNLLSMLNIILGFLYINKMRFCKRFTTFPQSELFIVSSWTVSKHNWQVLKFHWNYRIQQLQNILFDLPNIDLASDFSIQALKINEFVGLKFCEGAMIRNTNTSATATNCSANAVGLTWVTSCLQLSGFSRLLLNITI